MVDGRWKLAVLMLVAVAALAVGETFIARGMKQVGSGPPAGWLRFVVVAASNPWVVSGAALLGLHLALYALALSRADLSLVMPITAASYPMAALLSRFFLREDTSPARWMGIGLVTLGVAVVAWDEARSGG